MVALDDAVVGWQASTPIAGIGLECVQMRSTDFYYRHMGLGPRLFRKAASLPSFPSSKLSNFK
jgi:hypothetical protein